MLAYVLEHNGYVINGPRAWNYRSFESTLEEDLEIIYKLPNSKSDDEIITIDDNTHIYVARLEYPNYNQLTHWIDGPFWDFSTGVAVGTFNIILEDVEVVKTKLKTKVTTNRYNKEIAGTKVIVQDKEVTVDTSRDGRNIFVQKYMLMSDTETVNWKFPEGWLTLTKEELGQVIFAGASYIQAQFDWEINTCENIDSKTVVDDLLLIDVGDPKPVGLIGVS